MKKMNEEKKYSYIGKVEIGTDEYRDLISCLVKAEADADSYKGRYWSEQSKTSDLENKLEAMTEKANAMSEFINSSEELKAKYALFLVSKQQEESEE